MERQNDIVRFNWAKPKKQRAVSDPNITVNKSPEGTMNFRISNALIEEYGIKVEHGIADENQNRVYFGIDLSMNPAVVVFDPPQDRVDSILVAKSRKTMSPVYYGQDICRQVFEKFDPDKKAKKLILKVNKLIYSEALGREVFSLELLTIQTENHARRKNRE